MANCQRNAQTMDKLRQRYHTFPNDLQIVQPVSFNILPTVSQDERMQSLQASLSSGERVPITMNPSAQLYSRGNDMLTLAAPASAGCSAGCLQIHSDPRSNVVKPLYQQHIYKTPHSEYTYNTGMYP